MSTEPWLIRMYGKDMMIFLPSSKREMYLLGELVYRDMSQGRNGSLLLKSGRPLTSISVLDIRFTLLNSIHSHQVFLLQVDGGAVPGHHKPRQNSQNSLLSSVSDILLWQALTGGDSPTGIYGF